MICVKVPRETEVGRRDTNREIETKFNFSVFGYSSFLGPQLATRQERDPDITAQHSDLMKTLLLYPLDERWWGRTLLYLVYIFDKIYRNDAHLRAFLKGGIASHAADSCRRHPNCYKNRDCLQKNGKILAHKRISWSFLRQCPIQTSVVFGLSRSHYKALLFLWELLGSSP